MPQSALLSPIAPPYDQQARGPADLKQALDAYMAESQRHYTAGSLKSLTPLYIWYEFGQQKALLRIDPCLPSDQANQEQPSNPLQPPHIWYADAYCRSIKTNQPIFALLTQFYQQYDADLKVYLHDYYQLIIQKEMLQSTQEQGPTHELLTDPQHARNTLDHWAQEPLPTVENWASMFNNRPVTVVTACVEEK
ncbi:MAG TPA: hypothetical protein VHZ76_06940, partial [Gammaproteobacteria bacterium]|nr:hypothetical protein [Gammaproteobacteria bacterium]